MWEAITALATLGTGIAIVLTVLLGIRQLRLTGAHLAHLRRATQLEGAMKIFDDFFAPEFRSAMRFVINDLQKRMEDPEFRAGVSLIGAADDNVHKELSVLRSFERVGTFVKNGLIDGPIIYDLLLSVIFTTWDSLAEVVAIHRGIMGPALWENYEFLYNEGKHWLRHSHEPDAISAIPSKAPET